MQDGIADAEPPDGKSCQPKNAPGALRNGPRLGRKGVAIIAGLVYNNRV